jgi:signal transduction histidine kinase/class 3 adenylate cyclase
MCTFTHHQHRSVLRSLFAAIPIVFVSSLPAQDIDSLWGVWKDQRQAELERLNALDYIIWIEYLDSKPDSAFTLAQLYYDLALQGGYRNGQASASYIQGVISKRRGEYAEALVYYNRSLDIYNETSHKQGQAQLISNIAEIFFLQGDYPRAIERKTESLRIYENIGDKKGVVDALVGLANSYVEQGDYATAINHYTRSLKTSEEIGSKSGAGVALLNIGNIYQIQGDFDRALDHIERSLMISQEIGDKRMEAQALEDIGNNFYRQHKDSVAVTYYQRSLRLREEIQEAHGVAQSLCNLGSAYHAMGDEAKALDQFDRSLKMFQALGEKSGEAASLIGSGRTHLSLNHWQQSIELGNRALKVAMTIRALEQIRDANELLYSAYKATNQFAKALQTHELFVQLRDSAASERNQREVIHQEYKYNYDKRALADSLKHTSELAQVNNEKVIERLRADRNRNRALGVGGGVILLLAGGTAFYISDRKRRERKKALLQEQAMNTRLRHLDKLKDQFLANTSHELRTPLNGIIGLSESLYEGVAGEPTDRMKENLSMIISSGRRLAGLINDILDFSKLREKDITLALQPVDLKTIVEVDLRIMQPSTLGKDLRLVNNIDQHIPAVVADENRLQQILLNLVGNAVKFTGRGSVTVSAREENGMVAIAVADTGIGIPADKLKDIFVPFEQADSSAQRQFGGTGLGLTITKQLVELHGGTLYVQSVEGEGTTFTFTLPVSMEKAVAPARGLSIARPRNAGVQTSDASVVQPKHEGAFRILVVDDEPVNRQVVANYLTNGPFEVRLVSSGPEALKAVEESACDLVLLDVMMPGMSGYEVCQRLREKYLSSELPVIMLTAKDQVNDLVEGFNTGANDYLIKPVSRPELLARIKTHLNLLKINNSFSRFVPRDFLRSLGKENILEVRLGDQIEDNVAVMFSDIRGYTTLSESMTVDQNFRFLNSFLGRVGPVIQQHQGFVNQFLGDGLMALFQRQPENALKAAIDMQKVVSEHNKARVPKGRLPVHIGIGVHYGPLMMGIIGDDKRMDAGVVSDTVNTASRVEGLTKYYGASILLSQDTVDQIENLGAYHHRSLGKVMMKGKRASLAIYEFFDGQSEQVIDLKEGTKSQLDQGLVAYYERRFTDAAGFFKKVTEADPKDLAALIFLRNCANYMVHGVPPDWAGVEEMTSK